MNTKYIAGVCMVGALLLASASADTLFREDFENLDAWKPLLFPKIEAHSEYTTVSQDDQHVLQAKSKGSASGVLYTNTYNIYEFPRLKWRWKTDGVYEKGNAATKEGDDYPIRIYIVFKYNPKKAGVGTKMKYGLARKLYGEYPPHSTLNYIWANRLHDKKYLVNPYTDKAVMVPMEHGSEQSGQWIEESVDVVRDYKAAFGEDPPKEVSIAIMNDSDNTGESSVSYIDYIEVYNK